MREDEVLAVIEEADAKKDAPEGKKAKK